MEILAVLMTALILCLENSLQRLQTAFVSLAFLSLTQISLFNVSAGQASPPEGDEGYWLIFSKADVHGHDAGETNL